MITVEKLLALRHCATKATPGPWEWNPSGAVVDPTGNVVVNPQSAEGNDIDHIVLADPPTVLALLDRIAELEARDRIRLPVNFEQSALVERIQHALDNATLVDGLTLADIVADAVLDFMPPPVRPDPEPPEVTAAMAEAQALLEARRRIAELEAKTSKLQAALDDANLRCEMACETPADGCECAGCSFAAEHHAGIESE